MTRSYSDQKADPLTKAPTAEALLETVAHALAIAPQFTDDAAWLWIDAYWPPKRDRDRPSRPLPPGADPDHIPGERLALGVGNDQSRSAYTRAALLAVDAHRIAGVAVCSITGRQPPPARRRPARGHDLEQVIDATVRRLRWLVDHDIAHATDRARLDAHAAAVALIEAHAALRAVLRDVDGTGEPEAARRCTNCGDPCTPGRGRRECEKCARYRQRTGRARLIRRHADAYAARDRRTERGERYAENPAPAGRYVDGVWQPAAPHPDREAS